MGLPLREHDLTLNTPPLWFVKSVAPVVER
jgi:hypothetical protein